MERAAPLRAPCDDRPAPPAPDRCRPARSQVHSSHPDAHASPVSNALADRTGLSAPSAAAPRANARRPVCRIKGWSKKK